MTGLVIGGVGIGGNRLQGLFVGGGIGADTIDGAGLSLAYLSSDHLRGFGTGAYTRTRTTRGLTIGLFNSTDSLHGVQIGLLNHAGNNPRGLQWLPGINAHF